MDINIHVYLFILYHSGDSQFLKVLNTTNNKILKLQAVLGKILMLNCGLK
jgi:hypothetical protein